jgi:hypothetical protein
MTATYKKKQVFIKFITEENTYALVTYNKTLKEKIFKVDIINLTDLNTKNVK